MKTPARPLARPLALALALALPLLFAPAAREVHAAPRYAITPTGAPGAPHADLAINRAGDIAGTAFVFSGGVLTGLGRLGGDYAEVGGVNDARALTGTVYSGFAHAEPYIYRDGVTTTLGALGWNTGHGHAINNSGMVAGMIDTSPFDYPNLFAFGFVHADGVTRALPTLGGRRSSANDINDAGVAVGMSDYPEGRGASAVRYENGAVTALGTLPGSEVSGANAVNERGDAAGHALVRLGDAYYSRAVLFSGGEVVDLGLLGGAANNSVAHDINIWGEVVGTESGLPGSSTGFLYTEGRLLDLNAVVAAPGGWTIAGARGINDRHQIAAWGCDAAGCQALLLSPLHTRAAGLADAAGRPGRRPGRPRAAAGRIRHLFQRLNFLRRTPGIARGGR
ncbi:hypothetical protein [Pseudoduganella namucuonensis]|uniref:HAF repeat-containing protein n=1 Tax=Pseudoduganella namucuonensis TaxID=1035707 RepID=A0A1I7KP05_9BURK|nr:hypothetical protein [Pseudoduganella namucuonensis]SFU99149.1 hypothetical protein SAMN05216552_101878 [Pseudoduganella namucuonensis]